MELLQPSVSMVVLVIATAAMFAASLAFMAAAWWLRRSNERKSARWAALEGRWRALLDEVAAGTLSQAELHASVATGERLVLVDFLYKQMVEEARPERRRLCQEVAEPYLGELVSRVRSGDMWQRARAIRTLAELATPERAREAIVAALDDSSPHVAHTAARAYARLKLGPVEALLQRIDAFQTWDRRLLRETLAMLGSDAAPALHRGLADGSLPVRVRLACADALAALRYGSANDTAAALLTGENDLELKLAALRLFRGLIEEPHRAAVRQARASPDPILQGQAVACLARIGDRSDIAELENALESDSAWVRFNAVRGLQQHRRESELAVPGAGPKGRE